VKGREKQQQTKTEIRKLEAKEGRKSKKKKKKGKKQWVLLKQRKTVHQ